MHENVGLVHDYLLVLRGAERAFAAVASCWDEAPVYTLLYDEEGTQRRFADREVTTSYLTRLPVGQARFRALLPLLPRAVERLPVQGHDLVVSSTTAFAHGVRVRPDAVHVSYCHTPFRYAWHERQRALDEAPALLRPALSRVLLRIRRWDYAAAQRVSHFIASGRIGAERIAEYYGREASIVHAPVEVERFSVGEPQDYFLVVAELVRHKRIDVAAEAAIRAGVKLKVVGGGPEQERLEATYGEQVEFLGRIGDDQLTRLYSGARALVVPNVEEFGIAAVEAQAAGRPVVAVDAGGVRETVVDGQTGVLVPRDDPDALAEAIRETDFDRFDPARAREQSMLFSVETFREKFGSEVARLAALGPVEP